MAVRWNGRKWIRDEKRAAIYERDGWACTACGRSPKRRTFRDETVILSVDHLIPRSICSEVNEQTPGAVLTVDDEVTIAADRPNEAQNLVTMCLTCNSSRQATSWREFYPGGAQERVSYLIRQPLDIELGKAIIASMAGHPVEDVR